MREEMREKSVLAIGIVFMNWRTRVATHTQLETWENIPYSSSSSFAFLPWYTRTWSELVTYNSI